MFFNISTFLLDLLANWLKHLFCGLIIFFLFCSMPEAVFSWTHSWAAGRVSVLKLLHSKFIHILMCTSHYVTLWDVFVTSWDVWACPHVLFLFFTCKGQSSIYSFRSFAFTITRKFYLPPYSVSIWCRAKSHFERLILTSTAAVRNYHNIDKHLPERRWSFSNNFAVFQVCFI